MARNRMIKPEFWEDDKIGECSPTARLLFIALWNFADDEGYLEYRPKWIKARIFPYDSFEIEPLINELLDKGRLELRGNILSIVHFLDHQKIEKPKASDLSQIFKNSVTPPRTVTDSSPTKREEKRREIEEKGSGKEVKLFGDKSPTPSQTAGEFFAVDRSSEIYLHFVQTLSARFGLMNEIVRAELDKFFNYWTEKNRSGTKARWELERTFEVQKRLQTWFSNVQKFSPKKPSATLHL